VRDGRAEYGRAGARIAGDERMPFRRRQRCVKCAKAVDTGGAGKTGRDVSLWNCPIIFRIRKSQVTRFQRGGGFMASLEFVRFQRASLLSAIFLAVVATHCGSERASAFDGYNDSQQTPETADDVASELAAQHLRDNLLDEVVDNFRLFIYVNKARSGLLAQRMYVFDKADDGSLTLLYDWPVSTGRGDMEVDMSGHSQSTRTPSGFFELDPARMYETHVSAQWDEAMPYALFFDWKPNGRPTGIAIHGTTDENASELGTPASAGCIRLSLENAHVLFDLVRTDYRGPTPKLAYLGEHGSVSSEGLLLHDQIGDLQMTDGYSVLVYIDDFGGEGEVASLF
jgi:hypothetical protein